ncbi:MAG: LPS export ABC transporter periplasmic protein LptC [Alphaproteobacteria bacterium]
MDDPDLKPLSSERLERLSRRGDSYDYNPAYSRLIRKLRVLLPIIAAAAITVTFVWSSLKPEDIVAIESTDVTASTQNELLNPSFESRDEKGQPYKLTAQQAKQAPGNEKLILLTRPSGDLLLNEGARITLEAETGEFTQGTRQLLLHGDVKLSHDKGYQLTTEQLHIDMANSTTDTDTSVNVKGPDGTLDAAGLKGYSQEGRLVFNGPAKLVLTDVKGNNGLKGLATP